jgi:signal transduction histidine kinase
LDTTIHTSEEAEPAAIVVHQDVTALKEAERIKDEFIGVAAHELRTPLAVLKGFAQTLIMQTARGKGPELADWQLEALQGIDQATLRLVELTEDLLDVTRLQAGRLTLHLEPADLVALVQRVVTRLQMTTEKHTIRIRTPVEHLIVDVDPRRMEQVLSNLLGNAMKYSPEGGKIEIAIRKEVETHMALLKVCDHGIGIPAHQQSLIFGRFARADNARSHSIGGTGLGLYLCRELVERHGGRIWFESTEGQGSIFFIALPLTSLQDL